MAALDRRAFGTDRLAWLEALQTDARCLRVHQGPTGAPSAFGMLRPGFVADYLGPLVAGEPSAASPLVEDLLTARTRRTFWDLPEGNVQAQVLAEQSGFHRSKTVLRMWAGNTHVTGNALMQFASGDPSTG